MNIIVLIKPVPDLGEIKVSRGKGQVIEIGNRIMNSWDRTAMQLASDLKKEHNGSIHAISICREKENEILREAFTMGADNCYQLTDSQFKSEDAFQKTIILSRAISKLPQFDLILCGARSDVGFSGQIGPRVAESLKIPQATSVTSVSLENDEITFSSSIFAAAKMQKIKLPALLTVDRFIREPKLPNALMIMKAYKKEIIVWTAEDLGLGNEDIGQAGALTKVYSQYLAEVE